MRKKLLSILALLCLTGTSARADWTGGTYTATANENLGSITVSGDATLTINEGVTVTVSGGINVTSGTLTVNGLGTLEVTGADGANGYGAPGSAPSAAISGNIIVQGATVTANGGQGGQGGIQNNSGHPGGNGGAAFSGAVTIYSGTITATGGKGGTGGTGINSGKATGDGGTGGTAFSSTLTYYGGNVTANGGAAGSAGSAISGATSGSAGTAGKAFASNSVTLVNTPTTLTGDGSTITTTSTPTVTDYQTVIISAPVVIYNMTANQVDGAYWSTFYSNEGNYQAPEGTQVFAVNLNTTTAEITMIPVSDRIVKSGEGVVLKNATTGSITMTLTVTDATDSYFSDNSLQGTMSSITNPDYGHIYVLGGKSGVGFYKLGDTGTIGANKAYLTYSGALAPEFFGFGETTDINTLNVERETLNGEVYDLQGRRVAQPTKGLYIVNGKKVVIK